MFYYYRFTVHIRNINMCKYIISTRRRELSGCVRAQAYNYLRVTIIYGYILILADLENSVFNAY